MCFHRENIFQRREVIRYETHFIHRLPAVIGRVRKFTCCTCTAPLLQAHCLSFSLSSYREARWTLCGWAWFLAQRRSLSKRSYGQPLQAPQVDRLIDKFNRGRTNCHWLSTRICARIKWFVYKESRNACSSSADQWERSSAMRSALPLCLVIGTGSFVPSQLVQAFWKRWWKYLPLLSTQRDVPRACGRDGGAGGWPRRRGGLSGWRHPRRGCGPAS